MNELTRQDAIQRIKDMQDGVAIDHLKLGGVTVMEMVKQGAMAELVAIFDLKEEDFQ